VSQDRHRYFSLGRGTAVDSLILNLFSIELT